jgi:transglutaminase-like putative cysteine protease
MNARLEINAKEPFHLLTLRCIVYTAALGAAVWPAATASVSIAVAVAGLAGVIAGRQLAGSRVRTWVVLAFSAGLVVLGAIISGLMGSSTAFAHAAGLSAAMAWTQGIALAPSAFGLIVSLRVASLRGRSLALLEVAAAATVVVLLFAGHRDYQLGNPRLLSDWAFSTGRDPWGILLVAGFATLGCVVILLLPRQRATRNVAAVLAMLALIWGFHHFFAEGSANITAGGAANGGFSSDDNKLNFNDRKQPDSDKKRPTLLLAFHDSFTPIDGQYHVRMMAYSELDGSKLGVAKTPGFDVDVPTQFASGTVEIPAAAMPTQFSREIRTSVALIAPLEAPAALVNPFAMSPETNPDPKYFVKTYGVRSRVLSAPTKMDRQRLETALKKADAGDPSWSAEMRKHYTDIPNDPRYKQLADKLLREAQADGSLPNSSTRSPYAQNLVFAKWLKESTRYNLSPGNGDMADPTSDFLFGSRKGFCVHYATALTYLLRSQGVPARVVGGFAAPLERRGKSSSMLFQESDAHAWCEIFLAGFGWIPLDGGSAESDEPTPPPPSDEMKSSIDGKFNGKKDEARTAEVTPPSEQQPPRSMWGIVLRTGAPLAALVVILYSIKIWRRLAPRWVAPQKLSRIVYRAMLDRLAEIGAVRQFGETREQFAQRLASLAPEFAELTRLHLRGAMGVKNSLDRREWLAIQKRVEAELARHASRFRRIVGRLNPVSWMLAM